MVDGFRAFAPDAANAGFVESSFGLLFDLEPEDFWFIARNELLAWAIGRWFPDTRSMLEVGCGTGYVLSGMERRLGLKRVVGTELFSAGLQFAQRRMPDAELYQLDATRPMPYVEEFDVVGCFDVLEHIPDDAAAFGGLVEAARPGGGVVITVPQHGWLWSTIDDYGHHQRRYTRRELVAKARAAGIEPLYTTSFVTLLLPLMLLSRLLDRGNVDDFDPVAEHKRARHARRPLGAVMTLERALIRAGVRLPIGGSLLLVGRRSG